MKKLLLALSVLFCPVAIYNGSNAAAADWEFFQEQRGVDPELYEELWLSVKAIKSMMERMRPHDAQVEFPMIAGKYLLRYGTVESWALLGDLLLIDFEI